MQIQLFISGHAAEGDRLRAALRDALADVPVTEHQNREDIGREAQAAFSTKNMAVVMVAGREELVELSELKNTWGRLWTILVLPSSEPEFISLGHLLRPRFITFTESDFSDIVAVLKYIQKSLDMIPAIGAGSMEKTDEKP